MRRSLIIILFASFICASAIAESQSFAEFTSNNPGYFSIGFGSAIMTGAATHFSAPVISGGKQVNANISITGDVGSSLSGGYRFAAAPVRLGFSFVSMLSNVGLDSSAASNLTDGGLTEKIYTIATLYDYALTPHWVASAGAAMGFVTFSSDSDMGSSPIHSSLGFSYQAVAELMYRFTELSVAVTYHFVGTTVAADSIYPSANNSHYLLGNYVGVTGGIMFW